MLSAQGSGTTLRCSIKFSKNGRIKNLGFCALPIHSLGQKGSPLQLIKLRGGLTEFQNPVVVIYRFLENGINDTVEEFPVKSKSGRIKRKKAPVISETNAVEEKEVDLLPVKEIEKVIEPLPIQEEKNEQQEISEKKPDEDNQLEVQQKILMIPEHSTTFPKISEGNLFPEEDKKSPLFLKHIDIRKPDTDHDTDARPESIIEFERDAKEKAGRLLLKSFKKQQSVVNKKMFHAWNQRNKRFRKEIQEKVKKIDALASSIQRTVNLLWRMDADIKHEKEMALGTESDPNSQISAVKELVEVQSLTRIREFEVQCASQIKLLQSKLDTKIKHQTELGRHVLAKEAKLEELRLQSEKWAEEYRHAKENYDTNAHNLESTQKRISSMEKASETSKVVELTTNKKNLDEQLYQQQKILKSLRIQLVLARKKAGIQLQDIHAVNETEFKRVLETIEKFKSKPKLFQEEISECFDSPLHQARDTRRNIIQSGLISCEHRILQHLDRKIANLTSSKIRREPTIDIP